MANLIVFLSGIGVLTAMIAVFSLWEGIVLKFLWAWFIVPTFGVAALGLAPAIGLCLIIGYITYQYSSADYQADANFGNVVTSGFVRPLMALIIGYAIHLCM